MVKDTIIEEKNCFSDDSARRFMQTIQQMSRNISNPDLSLHSSPSRPYPLCLSGFREVKSFLYLFTHSSPLFTHIEFVIHYTQYGKKRKQAIRRNFLLKSENFMIYRRYHQCLPYLGDRNT